MQKISVGGGEEEGTGGGWRSGGWVSGDVKDMSVGREEFQAQALSGKQQCPEHRALGMARLTC